MKKTKDEPVGATGAGTEVVIGGSVANEVDSNNTNKDNNKKQGTLRKIFTRKQSEVYVPQAYNHILPHSIVHYTFTQCSPISQPILAFDLHRFPLETLDDVHIHIKHCQPYHASSTKFIGVIESLCLICRWKDGEVSKDKVEVVKDKDTDKDKQKDKDKDKDKDTAAGGAALLRPKRPERIKPLGRALTIASIAPPVSPRYNPPFKRLI